MNTYKLSIPLHMNMDYVKLIMANWDQTVYIAYDLHNGRLDVIIVDDPEEQDGLCHLLDYLWCSKSPDGSVGFVDFLQTFGG